MDRQADQRSEADREAALEARMRWAVLLTAAPAAYLAGQKTMGQCMRQECLRDFLGHALLDEILPVLPGEKEEKESCAVRICRDFERAGGALPLRGALSGAVGRWADEALPLLEAYCRRYEAPPSCLCFGLSALIMLWTGPMEEGDMPDEDGEAIRAFGALSCDMPPETLSYAVLSDQTLWGRDLREIPGLEEKISAQIQDLQIIGLLSAMEKAWKK